MGEDGEGWGEVTSLIQAYWFFPLWHGCVFTDVCLWVLSLWSGDSRCQYMCPLKLIHYSLSMVDDNGYQQSWLFFCPAYLITTMSLCFAFIFFLNCPGSSYFSLLDVLFSHRRFVECLVMSILLCSNSFILHSSFFSFFCIFILSTVHSLSSFFTCLYFHSFFFSPLFPFHFLSILFPFSVHTPPLLSLSP